MIDAKPVPVLKRRLKVLHVLTFSWISRRQSVYSLKNLDVQLIVLACYSDELFFCVRRQADFMPQLTLLAPLLLVARMAR